jgi:hypothetical protein
MRRGCRSGLELAPSDNQEYQGLNPGKRCRLAVSGIVLFVRLGLCGWGQMPASQQRPVYRILADRGLARE